MDRDARWLRRARRLPRLVALGLGSAGAIGAGLLLSAIDAGPAWADQAVVSTAPSSPSNNLHPSWTFVQKASELCELLNPNGTTFSAWTVCTSPVTYNLTGHPDGTYTFYVADAGAPPPPAGEISNPSFYTLDTTPPAAPTFTSAPASPGNNKTPSWDFTAESGSVTKCQVKNSSGTVISAYSACTSPVTVDLSAEPDDTYTLSVTATDKAGNTSAPATSSYQLLTTAPNAPTFTVQPSSPGNNKKPSWSFTTPSGTTTTCQVTNSARTVLSAYASCTSPVTVDLSSEPDDVYTLSVVATDLAGNKSSPATSSYQLLTAVPASPSIVSAPQSPGNSTHPTWIFSSPAGTTTTCQITNSVAKVISAYAPCASPYTADLSAQPDDTYTLSIIATDAAGNASAPTTSGYQLLTTPPTAPTITSTPTSPGSSRTPTWKFTAPAGTTTACRVTDSAGTVISEYAFCSSPITIDLTGRPDDTYTLSIEAIDAAGNVSTPATSDYQLLTTPPAAPTITSGPASSDGSTLAWAFSSPAGTTTFCQLTGPGGTVVSAWAACSSPVSFPVSGGAGTYTLSVRATDAAGNTSPVTTGTFQIVPPPPPPAPAPAPVVPPPAPPAPPAPIPPAPVSPPPPPPPPPAPPPAVPPAPPVAPPPPTPATSPPAPVAPTPAPQPPPVAPPAPIPPAPVSPPPAPAPVSKPVAATPAPPRPVAVPRPAVPPPAPAPAPAVAVRPPVRHAAPAPPISPGLVEQVRRVGLAVSEGSAAALLLYLVLVLFLAVQNRIDRNDPKLALAPVYGEPDLAFETPPNPGDRSL
jgi:hypothetical protein